MRRYFSLLCILALLVGCYNTDEQLINEPIPSECRIFTASFEQNDTRTYVEEGNLLRWNAGDQITIFDSNTLNQQYQFDGETGDNGGTFSMVSNSFGTGNDLNCHYAVYPYNKDLKITETGVITATLPAEQSYAENSFGLGTNTMVAVTKDVDDTFLNFRNIGGYLKLQLYGENVTVKSITLTGNNNEKIAGKVTVTPAYEQAPTLAMSDDATTSITLNCGEGVKIGATEETATAFWIVVPPTTFGKGFTIKIETKDGAVMTKSTDKVFTIERNIIKPMNPLEYQTSIKIGDLIEYNGLKGVVFYVDKDLTKIMSVEETNKKWSTAQVQVATNAVDADNGLNNMAIIKTISDWETKFPAFKWCADYGEGWYLPAYNELLEIYNQRWTIISTLSENGYTTLETTSSYNPFYWSSTESSSVNSALDVYFGYGDWSLTSKQNNHRVRCIRTI